KKKISDVNKLQEDFESESTLSSSSIEDSNKKRAILEKGDTFEDWKSAEKQVEIYLKVVGFGVIKRHLEKNSYGEYCAKKRADVEETHKRDSVKIKCSWKQKFYDVAINDNTSQANKYQIYLSLTIVINNHAKSRMAATAVVSDKTKDSTYQWILKCLLRVTNGLVLRFDKEEKFEWLKKQINQIPRVGLPNIIERYFKRVD
ncbi:5115_t:CDS:2, partial [Rhizophagus irregularis]